MNFITEHQIIVFFIVLFFFKCSLIFSLILLRNYNRLKKFYKALKKEREIDIIETNKLLVEKSENDINLLFQVQTVLEEIIKMLRKSDFNEQNIIKHIAEIQLLIDFLVKKQQDK